MVAEVLLVAGAALILVASIGVNRFADVLGRMHSLSKATALGMVLVLLGGSLGLDRANDITFMVLAVGLQLLTSPVASILIARATYRAEGIPHHIDLHDELAATEEPTSAPD